MNSEYKWSIRNEKSEKKSGLEYFKAIYDFITCYKNNMNSEYKWSKRNENSEKKSGLEYFKAIYDWFFLKHVDAYNCTQWRSFKNLNLFFNVIYMQDSWCFACEYILIS